MASIALCFESRLLSLATVGMKILDIAILTGILKHAIHYVIKETQVQRYDSLKTCGSDENILKIKKIKNKNKQVINSNLLKTVLDMRNH